MKHDNDPADEINRLVAAALNPHRWQVRKNGHGKWAAFPGKHGESWHEAKQFGTWRAAYQHAKHVVYMQHRPKREQ